MAIIAAPEDIVRPLVEYYWGLGRNDKEIVQDVLEDIGTPEYGLSVVSLRRMRRSWGLQGVRKQQHTVDSIHEACQEIRRRFPNMGARGMKVHLRENYQMRVPERVLLQYFHIVEPAEVQRRKGRKFKRKRFWTAGVNDMWCFDQHDKWLRFGLFFHLGFEPGAGRLLYIRVWWTNKNPRLINSYYIGAAREKKKVPLVTQSDPGSENYGIANCHTEIRHALDPTLEGTLQHRWMHKKTNVKPEIMWSVLRRNWSQGFEDILDDGVLNGRYDPNNPVEKLIFLWIAVPWIQAELDSWVSQFNRSPRRADKHKLLPQGIPDLITAKPHKYNTLDFGVGVSSELLDEMEQRWAPPDHAVFQLVPPEFDTLASELYAGLGSPPVTSTNFWDVYSELLEAIRALPDEPDFSAAIATRNAAEEEELPLLSGMRELRFGDEQPGPGGLFYMGGLEDPAAHVPGEAGPGASDSAEEEDPRVFAEFSDEEGNEGDDGEDEGEVGRVHVDFTESGAV